MTEHEIRQLIHNLEQIYNNINAISSDANIIASNLKRIELGDSLELRRIKASLQNILNTANSNTGYLSEIGNELRRKIY